MPDRELYGEWKAEPIIESCVGIFALPLAVVWEWADTRRALGLLIGPFGIGVEWNREQLRLKRPR